MRSLTKLPSHLIMVALLSLFSKNLLAGPGDSLNMPAPDDPVLAMMDSLDVLHFFKNHNFTADRSKLNVYGYPKDSVPKFPDYVYRNRMQELDRKTPFELDFNPDVRAYIELYAVRRRGTASRMLGLAELYFPLFEEKLALNKMPLELKYLAIVESALNPTAKSRAGAMGLWQFMYGTGKHMGLEINSYIDERCDPEKSTLAACKYLNYLYKYYGNNWQLALAAYNAGPGNVNKAIRRSGGKKNYWELRPYLPRETAGYVPAFIAATYIMNYHKEHNIYPTKPNYFRYEIDSVYVRRQVSFAQINKVLPIAVEELRVLNPQYIQDIIPASHTGMPLYLPKNLIGDFITNEALLYRYLTEAERKISPDSALLAQGYGALYHEVARGEYLDLIASLYALPADSLKAWNQLEDPAVRLGQQLLVYLPTSDKRLEIQESMQQEAPPSNNSPASSGKAVYHTVRSGETLWAISKKYGVSMSHIKSLNKLRSDALNVGQRLKIKE